MARAIVHVMNRVVRRCFSMGIDPLTGKNYDHRKGWMEELLRRFASCFGIDLLCYSILSNHFPLVLDALACRNVDSIASQNAVSPSAASPNDGAPTVPAVVLMDTVLNRM